MSFTYFYIFMITSLLMTTYRMFCKVPLGKPFMAHSNRLFRSSTVAFQTIVVMIPVYLGVAWYCVVPMVFAAELALQKISDKYVAWS